MKKLAYVVVGVVVLLVILVGAVFIAPGVIDWNGYKPDIAQAAREATGRELAIDGDIEVSLSGSLVLSFSAGGIRFANADGMTPPEMATIGSVSGTIRLWPLLGRAVVVDSLVVSEPVINLGVDGQGRANWVFAEKPAAAAKAGPTAVDEGLPFADLTLGDVRIEKGRVSYKDSASGQAIEASDIAVKVALAGLASPLTVDGAMVLNAEPVKLQLGVETPEGLMLGPEAKASLALETKHLTASYKGRVLRRPVDGLDGEFALDVPSVGRLAAWLDRPFPEDQPDPGPLKVRARFAGEGAKVALESATIEGEALKAKASGSYDGPGEVAQIVLDIDSEALDIDRYLPPPVKGQAKAAPKAKPTGKPENPLAALSDEPLDLSALKGTKADVKVRIAGVKAAGYNIGEVAFVAVLDGGVLTADLTKLALYGGQVTGTTKLDASGDALGLEAALAVAKVKVDALAKAATGEASVVGIASGTLEARSSGKSPRDLAQNMKGELAFKLGGVDVKKAPKGSISSLDVTLLLPGLEKQPKLDASVVYNKQKVSLSATTDPVQKLLQADRFAADLKLGSKLVNAGYSGMVQRRPVPGLDGKLDLEIGSVAKLARWLGQPLAKGQPDPGPLRVAAVMAAKGETVVLKEAKITGKALDAKASGSYDGSGKVKKVVLNLESGVLDIDRYLPPAAKAAKPAPQG
ncbi:MAG: AsmA family protein, partial [Alphaproteobacteria bacterium]|nr:AsmA family protein [Alphaproteobacteria bacterium]